MQFAVTFRHMEPTEALKAYARERMERVRKYLPDPISCHVVFSVERRSHRIDVTFQLHNGLAVAGHEITENMYSSIDLCIAKIERQVRKYKGKLEGMKARPHHVVALPWNHSIVAEAYSGEGGDGQTNGVTQDHHDAGPATEFKVVKTEKFHAQPLSVADAIVQLNLLHEPFLVFCHDTDGRVAVVYKRDDGSYGLIETPASAA
ncbi:MAG TPA: ribosome-associated translation inhibitor RaiA [Kofleriaceae bacterium]|jgi:putative sigma-54 modulation protein|nr:ribosome-associated translation inhibitor RaiA [Kofleriaceae bacterium]